MTEVWHAKISGEVPTSEITNKLRFALNLLYKNDSFLLENSVHERSIAHKLAEYLQQQFPDWHVDCEYNKHGIDVKRLPRECNGKEQDCVYPDIVIHLRNTDVNLCVIEMKINNSSSVDKCDNTKLVEFTKQDGDYKYHLGVFIGFNRLQEPQIVFYENGEPLEV